MLEKGWNLDEFLFPIHKAEPLSLVVILQWPFWGWHGSVYENHVGRCSAPCKYYLVLFFFLKKNIVLQSKSLYNLVAGQLPKYICPSLNCLLFFTHRLYFPTSSLPTTTKLLQSPAPMWLLHVASDSDAGGTPNLLSTAYCLVPKESPHFILSLKVKP